MASIKSLSSVRKSVEEKLQNVGKQVKEFNITISPVSKSIEVGTKFRIPINFYIFSIPVNGHPDKTTLKVVTDEGYEINPRWFIRSCTDIQGNRHYPKGTAVKAIFAMTNNNLDDAFMAIVGKTIICSSKEEVLTKFGPITIWGFDFV